MSAKIVMDRLVANRGRYVDESGRDLKVAQFFATHKCDQGEKLVLIDGTDAATLRELSLMPDGQVVCHPKVLGRLEIRRGKVQYAVETYNNRHIDKLYDVWAL